MKHREIPIPPALQHVATLKYPKLDGYYHTCLTGRCRGCGVEHLLFHWDPDFLLLVASWYQRKGMPEVASVVLACPTI